jgi:nitrate/nitrite-specific signal transduction histidine kinase
MGKKGIDGVMGDGSGEGEMETMRLRLYRLEDMMQEQSKDLKAEVVSSQLSMKQEIKEQMDEFFTKLMKVQASTPPPQP